MFQNGNSQRKVRVHYTFSNTSTIDYCVASIDLLHIFEDFSVDIFDPLLSDKHNPIMLTLAINANVVSKPTFQQTSDCP